jgi:hypothetical protein
MKTVRSLLRRLPVSAVILFSLVNAAQTQTPAPPFFGLQQFVDAAVQSGQRRVVLPAGRYRVAPHDRQHLVLRNLKDVTLVADGFEMVCTETTRALTISHCTNVTVRGLVIDYDPLPFTQGRIVRLDADKKSAEIELFAGYPPAEAARNFKYEIFRPDTRTLRCSDRYVEKIETLDARHLRVITPDERADSPEQLGDLIVLAAEYAPHGSAAHAVECDHDVQTRLENVTLFASNCFGFLENDCDGNVYDHCRIDRRAPSADPVKRADARLRSLDADAFHSTGAVNGPAYLGCAARFMGDDAVNIHGDYHLVTAASGQELRVLAKGEMNIRPGDPVELVNYSGARLPDATALTVVPDGALRADERAFVARQGMDGGVKQSLQRAWKITLDRAENLSTGSVICAANRIGNGFAVKNCEFGFNRSRGILIKASRGEITGNRLAGSRMSAILIAPEYWWLEAGSSSELEISGNTITDCGGIPICVEATGGDGQIAPAGAHRHLRITGNTIQNCLSPGILVTSTTGLTLADNRLELLPATNTLPDLMRRAGLKTLQPVVEIHCAATGDVEK